MTNQEFINLINLVNFTWILNLNYKFSFKKILIHFDFILVCINTSWDDCYQYYDYVFILFIFLLFLIK